MSLPVRGDVRLRTLVGTMPAMVGRRLPHLFNELVARLKGPLGKILHRYTAHLEEIMKHEQIGLQALLRALGWKLSEYFLGSCLELLLIV